MLTPLPKAPDWIISIPNTCEPPVWLETLDSAFHRLLCFNGHRLMWQLTLWMRTVYSAVWKRHHTVRERHRPIIHTAGRSFYCRDFFPQSQKWYITHKVGRIRRCFFYQINTKNTLILSKSQNEKFYFHVMSNMQPVLFLCTVPELQMWICLVIYASLTEWEFLLLFLCNESFS